MEKLIKLDNAMLKGNWRLTASHTKTGEIIILKGSNLIVSAGKGLMADMLIDKSGFDTGITYLAIGTSTTTPIASDTQLGLETARKAITTRTRENNMATFSTFLTAGESTFNIKEAGQFGHSTATATAGTGVLFSHWLVSFDNSSGLYDLTFDYILTIG